MAEYGDNSTRWPLTYIDAVGTKKGQESTGEFYTTTQTKVDADGNKYTITSVYEDQWGIGPVNHRFIGTIDSRYPDSFVSKQDGAENARSSGLYSSGTVSQIAYFSSQEGMRKIRLMSEGVTKEALRDYYMSKEGGNLSALEAGNKARKEWAIINGKDPTLIEDYTDSSDVAKPTRPPQQYFRLTGLPKQETQRDEMAGKPGQTLIYPQDHAQGDFDFIKIIPIEYIPMLQAGQDFNDMRRSLSVKQRYLRKEKVVGSTMFLPMVPGISESNATDWGGGTINPLQIAAGQIAANTITTWGNAKGIGDIGKGITEAAQSTVQAGQAMINNPATKAFITAYFAGKAVGTNLTARAGIVVNPNLEVLFNGPQLRTFQYNFKFTPRDDREAKTVKTIIKVCKKGMAPKRRDAQIFLNVPAVFKIKYLMRGREEHPFLNKIKPCAMTSFNVDYTPEGSYMTYGDGSMTSYNVQMNFAELEPIYINDIQIDSEDIGY